MTIAPAGAGDGTTSTALPIRARPVAMRWDGRPLPRHFVGDDLLLSHVAAVLSSMFPEGEAFFVRSVRAHRGRITDPDLLADIAGFIGQESVHAREHRALDRHLAGLGYPTRHLERRAGWALRLLERLLTPNACLAVTAALEHATATLAEAILSTPEVQELFEDDQVRRLLLWHALEECEHKRVAFEVYATVCGDHRLRTWPLRIGIVTSALDLLSGVATSLAFDPAARHPRALVRSARALRHTPFAGLGMGARLWDYTRRDFDPDDHDTTSLVDEWRARLFGTSGGPQPSDEVVDVAEAPALRADDDPGVGGVVARVDEEPHAGVADR